MSVPEDTFTPAPAIEAPAEVVEQTPQIEKTGADDQAQTQQEDQQGEESADQQRDDKGRFKPGVQSRIDELTRARHEAEREAAYWKGRASSEQDQVQPPAQAAAQKPTPDAFDDYGDYVEALTEWKADQKITQALTEREAKAAQRQQAEAAASTWDQRQAQARAELPDYDAVVGGSDAPVAQHVAEALKESEHGPALAYHLAKNPDVLDKLNSMSPREADRQIGRIEERLASQSKPAEIPAAKTTQAPKPATVVSSQGRSTTPDPSKMSMDEYAAFRSKGPDKARWAR